VVVARTIPDISETGDLIEVDVSSGVVRNLTKGVEERVAPYPREILEIIASGGIIEYIKRHGSLPWRGGTR